MLTKFNIPLANTAAAGVLELDELDLEVAQSLRKALSYGGEAVVRVATHLKAVEDATPGGYNVVRALDLLAALQCGDILREDPVECTVVYTHSEWVGDGYLVHYGGRGGELCVYANGRCYDLHKRATRWSDVDQTEKVTVWCDEETNAYESDLYDTHGREWNEFDNEWVAA